MSGASAPAVGCFSEWAAASYRPLLHVAFLLTGDRDRAQDLVQVALAKTHLAWRRVHTSPDAYVRRVLVTSSVDIWRRRSWREVPTDVLPDQPSLRDEGEEVVQRQVVLAALGTLTTRQRAVVVLRYYQQCSEAETAEALGCSAGTVKSTASRALARLRQHPGLARQEEVPRG